MADETTTTLAPGATGPAARATARPPGWVLAWFAVLMIVTIAARIADPTGWVGSDDIAYYASADHIVAGEPIQRLHHHYARMAITAPTALSIALFGASPTTVALPQTVLSILCVALVAVLGRLVWGWWEGLCAATVVSMLPYYHVLSTAAYPDAIACFFATLAVLLGAALARADGRRARWVLALGCGVALGLAISAKVFSITAVVAIAWMVWRRCKTTHRQRIGWLAPVAIGAAAALLAECLFYAWVADDFLYRFHAMRIIQTGDKYFPTTGFFEAAGVGRLILDRLTMPLNPGLSGWGWLGVAFLPAAGVVLLWNRRGRPLAAWALAMYLAVAFLPVSFHHGWQPFPKFYGRHILPACVPLALCLAWVVRAGAVRVVSERRIQLTWPIVLGGVLTLFLTGDNDVSGFRDRPTKRIGQAIERMVASGKLDGEGAIFMTPSTYWRYRILFPPEYKARIRVAADTASRDWWKTACPDITQREATLPAPSQAQLLVTPLQLNGRAEWWDYDVPLPADRLAVWQATEPAVVADVVGPQRAVQLLDHTGVSDKTILALIGEPSKPSAFAEVTTTRSHE